MAVVTPVDTTQDEQFAIACVSATIQLRFASLHPARQWTESAAAAVRTLVTQLGDISAGRQRRGPVFVVVALLTAGDQGLTSAALATSGYDRLEESEGDAREMIADAIQEQHSFELRTGRGSRKRIMMPMPAFRGSRWLAV